MTILSQKLLDVLVLYDYRTRWIYLRKRRMSVALLLAMAMSYAQLFVGAREAEAAVWTETAVFDMFVDDGGPYPGGYESGKEVYVGFLPDYGESQAAIRFDLTDLPPGATVTNATLSLYVVQSWGVTGVNPYVQLYGTHADEIGRAHV